jgi:hypothetical protein
MLSTSLIPRVPCRLDPLDVVVACLLGLRSHMLLGVRATLADLLEPHARMI